MIVSIFPFPDCTRMILLISSIFWKPRNVLDVGGGSGQPNGAIPSLPSPTMPTFNMAAQTPNGQPAGNEGVYTNGIPQTYPARKYYTAGIFVVETAHRQI